MYANVFNFCLLIISVFLHCCCNCCLKCAVCLINFLVNFFSSLVYFFLFVTQLLSYCIDGEGGKWWGPD